MSTVTFESSRFGTLEIASDDVIEFPTGLIGLGGTRYAARRRRRRRRLRAGCTRSTTRTLALPVANPWQFFADYEVELSDERRRAGQRRPVRRRRLGDGPRRRRAERLLRQPARPDPRRRGQGPPGHQRGRRRPRPRPAVPGRRRGRPRSTADPSDRPQLNPRRNHAAHHPPCRREDHGRRRCRRARDGDRRQHRSRGHPGPALLPVYREEIWHAVREENRAAAEAAPVEFPLAHAGVDERGLVRARGCSGLGRTVCAWTLPRPPATSRLLTSPWPSLAIASRDAPGRRAAQKRRLGAKTCCWAAASPPPSRPVLQARRRHGPAARSATPRPRPAHADAYAPPPVVELRRRRVRLRTPRPPCPSRPPHEEPAIDEAAEEAAAAAEAANIGGTVSDYAGPDGESPTRPSARWPRPARASPRARSRPRPSCARPPSPPRA